MIGGEPATRGLYPYAVQIHDRGSLQHTTCVCGGAIVGNFWVLTVQHCVYGKEDNDLIESLDIYVVAGDVAAWGYENNENRIEVEDPDFKVHPNHENDPINYDIVLLYFGGSKSKQTDGTQFHGFISHLGEAAKIELPRQQGNIRPRVGQECAVMGWGNTDYDDDVTPILSSEYLKHGKLKVVNDPAHDPDFYISVRNDLEKDGLYLMVGDSGSPLICKDTDGEPKLFGVLKSIDHRHKFGKYLRKGTGYYLRVKVFEGWMNEEMAKVKKGTAKNDEDNKGKAKNDEEKKGKAKNDEDNKGKAKKGKAKKREHENDKDKKLEHKKRKGDNREHKTKPMNIGLSMTLAGFIVVIIHYLF